MVVVTDQTARLERDRARAGSARIRHPRTPYSACLDSRALLSTCSGIRRKRASSEAAATIFQESGRLVAMINTYLDVLATRGGGPPHAAKRTFHVGETV